MKKKLAILLTGATAVGLAVFFFRPIQQQHPELPQTWVSVAEVKESALPLEISVIGSIEAKTIQISPERAGHIDAFYFRDGQSVTKGQKLVHLEDGAYKAKYAASLADYRYRISNFNRMKLLSNKGLMSSDAMDQADAVLKQRKAEMQTNEDAYKKMTLYAPFDGVLSKAKMHSGDYVNVGSSIVSLTDNKHLRVVYAVPEDYVAQLELGQQVRVKSKAFANTVFKAKISYISPTVSVENRSIQLYATIEDAGNQLKPGMFVNVVQVLGEDKQAILVPGKALVPVLGGEQIFKVVNDKVYAVSVSLGQRKRDEVQILNGIKAGDKIVTDGQLKLHNGMSVKIKS